MTALNELNLYGWIETREDADKIRSIVDRRGAAFVIDTAMKHQRAKEQAAHDRYQKERKAVLDAEQSRSHP